MKGGEIIATTLLTAHLIAVSWVDLQRMIIPNLLNASLAMFGIGFSTLVFGREIFWLIAQSAFLFLLLIVFSKTYFYMRGRHGLGGGDIKFLTAATCWVGLAALPWTILIASVSGLGFIILKFTIGQKTDAATRLPFGPHLSIGLFATWMMRDILT
jgi:leader peptidase (prepilin peptidase) / N-methyltransferase